MSLGPPVGRTHGLVKKLWIEFLIGDFSCSWLVVFFSNMHCFSIDFYLFIYLFFGFESSLRLLGTDKKMRFVGLEFKFEFCSIWIKSSGNNLKSFVDNSKILESLGTLVFWKLPSTKCFKSLRTFEFWKKKSAQDHNTCNPLGLVHSLKMHFMTLGFSFPCF